MGPFDGWGFTGFMTLGMSVFMVVFFILFLAALIFIISRFVAVGRMTRAARSGPGGAGSAPEVQAQARVIGKRMENLGQSMAGGLNALPSANTVVVRMGDDTLYQRYLVGFEQPDGTRFELEAPTSLYGVIAEGDQGTVTMRGAELIAFNREVMR